MKPMKRVTTICFAALAGVVFAAPADEEGFVPLFDGRTLEGWTSAHSKGGEGGDWGPFKVDEAEKSIHVYKGEEAGSEQSSDCLVSDKDFSRYVFRMEYKWGEKRFAPRADHDRDAGLLFHVHGDLTKVWPFSLEMQIGETAGDDFGKPRYHTGDLFVLGKHLGGMTTRTKQHYDAGAALVKTRHCPTPLGVEKPKGEWNEIELIVDGAKQATFKLNGEVVLVLHDMESEVDGKRVPLDKGRIAIQAEWAELHYRNLRIKELD